MGWKLIANLGIALTLILGPGTASAQEGTRPEYARPLTATEARALRAEIARSARQLGLHLATLDAIAEALGRSSANTSFSELIRLVRAKAREAATLRTQLVDLRHQLALVTNAEVRGPAEQALSRANRAFDQGRLDEADRELAEVAALRLAESGETSLAWETAVDSRAHIAELQLDFDRATDLRLAAAGDERERSALRQWRLVIGAADAQYEKGRTFGDVASLLRAIDLYRSRGLALVPRAEQQESWASTQNSLGVALLGLSDYQEGTDALDAAVSAFRLALEVYDRERFPLGWAMVQLNLGVALGSLGGEHGRAGAREEAGRAFLEALTVYTRERAPAEWTALQTNIAVELITSPGTGEDRDRALVAAIDIFRQILTVRTREQDPAAWASTQYNLAATLETLGWRQFYTLGWGTREAGAAMLNEAVTAYRRALQIYGREAQPMAWAQTQKGLGDALFVLGEGRVSRSAIDDSVQAYRAALEVYTRERMPRDWADTSRRLAEALLIRAQRSGGCQDVRNAISLLSGSIEVFALQGSEGERNGAEFRMTHARELSASRCGPVSGAEGVPQH